jgi:hypothetical protein
MHLSHQARLLNQILYDGRRQVAVEPLCKESITETINMPPILIIDIWIWPLCGS